MLFHGEVKLSPHHLDLIAEAGGLLFGASELQSFGFLSLYDFAQIAVDFGGMFVKARLRLTPRQRFDF